MILIYNLVFIGMKLYVNRLFELSIVAMHQKLPFGAAFSSRRSHRMEEEDEQSSL